MRAARLWPGLAALALCAAAGSCGRSKPVGVGPGDAGSETAPPASLTAACLDRPDELPRPPTAGLPCDLIPPGLTL